MYQQQHAAALILLLPLHASPNTQPHARALLFTSIRLTTCRTLRTASRGAPALPTALFSLT